jgi:hypothetical protein|tara:strand:+ start:2008 stop:2229 length:222 start_codon:yes stop_codon:yes gene_type:complete
MADYTKNFSLDTGNILSNIPGGKVLRRLGISGGGVTYTQKDPFGTKNSSLGTRVKMDINGNVTGAGLEFVKKF